mmetsp:Transcript_11763/g.16966  ORF Transcript_11763/g.16966 Transcript_11763/m.16966 type:complete len:231 (-) Transcript_11763:125-817(-)|eukprot:CAMPEP_0172428184 /NCGR_PEP_ID=MMETSP1064-20121228/45375_1 /TAXON_ID=202472 /ORGANISM="Aulacoseira subarctica , Strain CCAP 1002/5" /LENGTH=230 /DNA_ID=CAMNT_0013172831 /DNA_START=53 /DNA_END=745 /DNA_ORIENTATION=+
MSSNSKRKHEETFNPCELYDLCSYIDGRDREDSFDSIRQWLNIKKEDINRLKTAIIYQDRCERTSLQRLLSRDPPLDIVQQLIQYAPEVLQIKDNFRFLPIHFACRNGASLDIVKALVHGYPESVTVVNCGGRLPLHLACYNGASLEVLNFLIEFYPQSMEHKDNHGETPLFYLKEKKYAEKRDVNGLLPLHRACNNGYSEHLIHFLKQAYPDKPLNAEIESDLNVMFLD